MSQRDKIRHSFIFSKGIFSGNFELIFTPADEVMLIHEFSSDGIRICTISIECFLPFKNFFTESDMSLSEVKTD